MTTAGSFDAPIEIFGGLVTDMSPADLPHGVSPDCQDVIYSNGGVATRPGLQSLFGPLAGNPTINYVKTYETLNATLRTILLDSNGVLYKETTPGTLASIATGLAPNAYANSTTLFGREYLAISDGKTGNDLPRQFDDTNFDRVSQGGPGAGPTVVDENVIVAITASPNGATQPAAVTIAAGPSGATENGFLVTITTTAAHGLSAGQSVTIAGVGVAGYNGTFPVVSAPTTTQFTYIAGASGLAASGGGTAASTTATIQTNTAHGFVAGQLVTTSGIGVSSYNGTFPITTVPDATHFTFTAVTGGLAASGGGTAAAAGSVSSGVHQVCVIFKTRQGYLTKPGPATSWTSSGGKRAVVTNIPTGPSNVVGRILCFTGAGGASFFYTSSGSALFSGNMVIADNSSTSVVVDFSDAILLAGTNVDNLFRLIELGDCSGVTDYAERLFWWGERNKMNNWANLGFDGGFTGPSFPHYNEASPTANLRDLPWQAQTVIADIWYNMGDLRRKAPRFWNQVIRGAWQDAYDELNNRFAPNQRDDSALNVRARRDAQVLKEGIDSGELRPPGSNDERIEASAAFSISAAVTDHLSLCVGAASTSACTADTVGEIEV